MPTNLRPSRERFVRDRRRISPRVQLVIYNPAVGNESLVITFDRKMDTTRTRATFRHFAAGIGVQQFTGGSWLDERTWQATTMTVISGSYSGVRNAQYMVGNFRGKRRFMLWERERCERVEDI